MNREIKTLGLLVLVFLWLSPLQAQESSQQAGMAKDAQQPAEYQVGPGDVLSIRVFGLSQFDQNTRISNSGKIHIPYAGVISVAGMTVARIEDQIAKSLRERQLVKEPWVQVQVVEFNAQPVFLVGEITSPGQYMITGEMRLLDAITRAGGLKTSAGEEAILMRRSSRTQSDIKLFQQLSMKSASPAPQPGRQESAANTAATANDDSVQINIAQLTDGSRPELNVRLQGGDVVYVPVLPTRLIYIIGEVGFAGAYILPRNYSNITAASALAYAGGPRRKTAKSNKAFVVRQDAQGAIQATQFNFSKTIKGEQNDIPIKPNDIIFVPRSVAKMTGYKFFDMFAHLTQQWMIF